MVAFVHVWLAKCREIQTSASICDRLLWPAVAVVGGSTVGVGRMPSLRVCGVWSNHTLTIPSVCPCLNPCFHLAYRNALVSGWRVWVCGGYERLAQFPSQLASFPLFLVSASSGRLPPSVTYSSVSARRLASRRAYRKASVFRRDYLFC